jgi:hypothetical protein
MALIKTLPDHTDDAEGDAARVLKGQSYDDEAALLDEIERQNDLYYTHKSDK